VGLVASSPSSPSSEIGYTIQERSGYVATNAAFVVDLDDFAASGEPLVTGRFAVFVVKDRPVVMPRR
jgi:hypothetical protein